MLGTLIKDYIQANGLKQSFVAEKSGLTDKVISDICNDKRSIDCIEYYKICKALGVPLEFFLKGVEI